MTDPESPTHEPKTEKLDEAEADKHMDPHTAMSGDDHGHGEPVLGPIDVGGWIYALVGVGAGLIVIVFFYLAIT